MRCAYATPAVTMIAATTPPKRLNKGEVIDESAPPSRCALRWPSHSKPFRLLLVVLLPVLFVGDHLVAVGADLPFARIAHRRLAPLVGAEREGREQTFELAASASRTCRRVAGADERFELVTAALAAKVVERHEGIIDELDSMTNWQPRLGSPGSQGSPGSRGSVGSRGSRGSAGSRVL